MFEDITIEGIKKDILDRIDLDLSKEKGSFLYQVVSGIAFRIWNTYQGMNALIPIAYVDETSGEYLDKRCAEVGIIRKAGTKAQTVLHFVGKSGLVLPEKMAFLTADGLTFCLDEAVTLGENGTASGMATAVEVGRKYNIGAGKIVSMYVNLSGLTSYSNDAASGGEDAESDKALYARLVEYWQMPATSGNVNEYRSWALSVDGVGYAKVLPTWNGAGTVKVIIASPEQAAVDSATISRCAQYIESVRPIGAAVTVVSAVEKSIQVNATVTVSKGVTAEDVQASFVALLKQYIETMAFQEGAFSYNRVGYLLLGCEGVEDFSVLTLNGGTTNVQLGSGEIPVLGEVVITLAEDD